MELVAVYYSLQGILWNWQANCCNTIQLSFLCQNAHTANRHQDTVTWHGHVPNAGGDYVEAATSLITLHAASSNSNQQRPSSKPNSLKHAKPFLNVCFAAFNNIKSEKWYEVLHVNWLDQPCDHFSACKSLCQHWHSQLKWQPKL